MLLLYAIQIQLESIDLDGLWMGESALKNQYDFSRQLTSS